MKSKLIVQNLSRKWKKKLKQLSNKQIRKNKGSEQNWLAEMSTSNIAV